MAGLSPPTQAINDILEPFAPPPNYMFVGTSRSSLESNFQITNYVFTSGGMNILTFTVRINKKTKSAEFIIDSTKQKYIASSLTDVIKIRDFVSHLMVLEDELVRVYKALIKKLKVIPSANSLTTYHLFSNSSSNTGTINIKNSLIIFEYNEITKYTYSSIKSLLANPLIKQFKRSNIWFWT